MTNGSAFAYHLSVINATSKLMNFAPASLAVALASIVLPQPRKET